MKKESIIPIRSFLFVPGNHPKKIAKVFKLGSDAVILDLEDAVAISEKEDTRRAVVDAMSQTRSCRGYIRVNSLGTQFCEDDILYVIGDKLDGIVLPKVEDAETIKRVDQLMTSAEQRKGLTTGIIDLMPIIETARGVEHATAIAQASPRVTRIAFGGGDYTLDLNYEWTEDEDVLAYARAKLSHASRIANIEPPIDTVVLQINDDRRFEESAARGKKFGFGGKLCIHPSQVPLCNALFMPSDAEIDHANAVIAAFEEAESSGSASIQLNGYFIDYPIVYKAQHIIALSKAFKR